MAVRSRNATGRFDSKLLDAVEALLDAIRRFETLAEELRVRACQIPPLMAKEAINAEQELAVAREGIAVLEAQAALFRQELRRCKRQPRLYCPDCALDRSVVVSGSSWTCRRISLGRGGDGAPELPGPPPVAGSAPIR